MKRRARLELMVDELPASDDPAHTRDVLVGALQHAAEQIVSGRTGGTLRDAQGNNIGHFIIFTRTVGGTGA